MREHPDDVRAYVDERGITFPVALQPDGATLLAYDISGLPVSALIGSDGSFVHRVAGPL